jgi:hypothetical protein
MRVAKLADLGIGDRDRRVLRSGLPIRFLRCGAFHPPPTAIPPPSFPIVKNHLPAPGSTPHRSPGQVRPARPRPFRLALAGMAACLAFSFPVAAQQSAADLAQIARTAIETADTEAIFQKADLGKKYATALEGLEKKFRSEGDLDAVLRVREEREEVLKSGTTSSHTDKALVDLRAKYTSALAVIDQAQSAAHTKAMDQFRASLRGSESALVKDGKVEEAVALRQEGALLLEELDGLAKTAQAPAAADAEWQEDPRSRQRTDRKELPEIEIPSERPEEFDKAFLQKDRWLDSLTVPQARQRVRENVVIGDRGKQAWPLVVVAPGSHWAGAGNTNIELSAGKIVAEAGRFEKLIFLADLECQYFFTRSIFDDCRFDKGGVWYGSEQAGKFYFKECLVRGSFSGNSINVVDHGFRAERTVFENVKFPNMLFRDKQPASYLNHRWLRLVHCRFVGCTLPLSFLYLTHECLFENCTFIDDPKPAKPGEEQVLKPIHLVIYVKDCRSRLGRLPENVTLEERPATDYKGPAIPTAAELAK